jgi:hypothetical protein
MILYAEAITQMRLRGIYPRHRNLSALREFEAPVPTPAKILAHRQVREVPAVSKIRDIGTCEITSCFFVPKYCSGAREDLLCNSIRDEDTSMYFW